VRRAFAARKAAVLLHGVAEPPPVAVEHLAAVKELPVAVATVVVAGAVVGEREIEDNDDDKD
jgi:hypothetical protein